MNKMIRGALVSLALLCIAGIAGNAALAATWSHWYDLGVTASSATQTVDGGVVAAGGLGSPSGLDLAVLKVDGFGNPVWQKAFGFPGVTEVGQSIAKTSYGGYIVAGNILPSSGPNADAWVLRLDADGTVLWQNAYGGPYFDQVSRVRQTSDGGFVVAGQIQTTPPSNGVDFWVLRLDGSGNVLWSYAYGGADEDRLFDIDQTPDGGFIAAGETSSFGAGAFDMFAMRLDASGQVVWQQTYGSSKDESAPSITQLASGDFVLAGYTSTSHQHGQNLLCDPLVVKVNSSGAIVWKQTYGTGGCGIAFSVQATIDGGVVVTGLIPSPSGSSTDGFAMKLNTSGAIQWRNRYGSEGDERIYRVETTTDQGLIAVGEKSNSLWLQKLDGFGLAGLVCPQISPISGSPTKSNIKDRKGAATGPVSVGALVPIAATGSDPTFGFQTLCAAP